MYNAVVISCKAFWDFHVKHYIKNKLEIGVCIDKH